VAEGFAGIEIAVPPRLARSAQLRLLAPWRSDPGEPRPEAEPFDATATAPLFDRRSATTALLNVLREWRVVARELEEIDPGSSDRGLLEAEDAALRDVHHRLFWELSRG